MFFKFMCSYVKPEFWERKISLRFLFFIFEPEGVEGFSFSELVIKMFLAFWNFWGFFGGVKWVS